MLRIFECLAYIVMASPGIGAIAFSVIVVRAILKGEITTATGRGQQKVYRTYKSGTFSFWLQIIGFLLFILFFSFIEFMLLVGFLYDSGHVPAWVKHFLGKQ